MAQLTKARTDALDRIEHAGELVRYGFHRPQSLDRGPTRAIMSLMPRADEDVFQAYRLSPDDLAESLERIRPFVAPFETVARSRPSKPTPHRLIRLIESTESDLRALQTRRPGHHLMDVVELSQIGSLLDEWKDDPIGQSVIRALADPRSYSHEILVLAAARFLKSWGNMVRRFQTPTGPSADLALIFPSVAVEVKAPRELADDALMVKRSPAEVADAALTASTEQLATQPTSVLIVGGYRLPAFVIESLSESLARRTVRRPGVIATIVLSIGSHPVDWPDQMPLRDALALQVTTRIRPNESYTGRTRIISRSANGEGLRMPKKSMTIRRAIP